jgi:hypothetical protein
MSLGRRHFKLSRGLIAALVLASLLVTPSVAAAPRAKGIYGGVIVVGRGVAGARLGMTRAQVIGRLGPPVSEMPNRGMSYEGLPPKNPHGQFDIALQGGRVRMFIISPRSTWRLANGIHIFASDAIARLMHCYGHRKAGATGVGSGLYTSRHRDPNSRCSAYWFVSPRPSGSPGSAMDFLVASMLPLAQTPSDQPELGLQVAEI